MQSLSQESTEQEIIIKRSRFIAKAFPVTTQEEARNIIKMQKEKHPKANHVVHAFCIGGSHEITGASDAGEPQGTAGKPMLFILQASDITNIIVTVVRYFGGTLLGTGGLVKAYSQCCKKVLETATTTPIILKKNYIVKLPYTMHDTVCNFIKTMHIEAKNKEYLSQEVKLFLTLTQLEFEALSKKICDISRGKIKLEMQENKSG